MRTKIEEKYLERIGQLLEKAENVKNTQRPNPEGVIGFFSVDDNIFNEWSVSCKNLIGKIAGESSSYYKDFLRNVSYAAVNLVDCGAGILRGLKEDIEMGMLLDMRDIAIAEIFSDFLDMAQHLLDNEYKDPAAFLTGAVLEDGLRKLCQKNSIKVKISDDISALNTKLADQNIYNRLIQSQIQTWKKLRDDADHGNFSEYNKQQVKDFLDWVGNFLSENIA